MRGLLAMADLAGAWRALAPAVLLDRLAELLLGMLDGEAAYVRLAGGGEPASVEALRSRCPDDGALYLPALRAGLDGARTPGGMDHPAGEGRLHAAFGGLGLDGELGAIVVVSPRSGFPSAQERSLLAMAASQATVVLQHRQAEGMRERSESRFRELADAAPAMLWVTEPDGHCSYLSRGWYAFTGQSEAEGLGLGWTSAIHPDDRPLAVQAFQQANDSRGEFRLEHRVLHVDGTYRWVIDMGRPRFAATGAFLGFVGNVLDITDRKQAVEALDEAREMLSTVFEALPMGVALADHEGKVLFSNQEMRQYLPTGKLPSLDDERHTRWQAFHEDGSRYARHEFPGMRAARGERVVPGIEALYLKDDGSQTWTQVGAVPVKGKDVFRGLVSIVTNIDAFKRTEAALRLAEAKQRSLFDELATSHRTLSQFLAVLAHELRNPLAPILTGLEIMRMRADSLETVTNVRGIIERQVRQLSHLIDDLLDIARVTNGKVEIRRETVDLQAIVANAVETSLPLIEKGRHVFSMELHEAALQVHVDATRIAQVIGNLLANAAKYTAPGGRIALRVGREGEQATITVTDNGIGIPADALESVFEMFSQVGRNMPHAQGGLGIGLSLVRQLVGMHGGSVAASSAGKGQGSSFVIRLPLHAAAAPALPATAPAAAPGTAGRRLRILVTDDNVDAALTLASLLEMEGHTLQVAHEGGQALRLAQGFQPDLVLLDIGLPDMSGYEVAARLRKIPGLERSAIAAVSGWGAKDDLARSKEAGFDMHFTKPVALAGLNAFLATLDRPLS